MTTETKVFDAAEFLDTENDVAAYLVEAFRDGDPHVIASAVGAVARARGMTKIAKSTGLSREALYNSLSSEGNPRLSTLTSALRAIGFELAVRPTASPVSHHP